MDSSIRLSAHFHPHPRTTPFSSFSLSYLHLGSAKFFFLHVGCSSLPITEIPTLFDLYSQKRKETHFTNIMRAQYFGFNVRPTPMEVPSSEANQKNEEQDPDPHHVASLDRVSHEKDSQGYIADSMAQTVLFTGWASFVLGKVL